MARKLRLNKGDYVVLRTEYHSEEFFIGIVKEVEMNDRDQWSEFGVYSYGIDFGNTDIDFYGWTIYELISGRLFYIDSAIMEVLYG